MNELKLKQAHKKRKKLLGDLLSEIQNLKKNLDCVLELQWKELMNDIFDLKNFAKNQNEEIQRLKMNYQNQTKSLENVQNELKMVKNKLYEQNEYITTLSSTFGSLLWRTSKSADVIHSILTDEKLLDLLQIIIDSVKTFFEMYEDKFELAKTEEKEFVLTFVGIISNIAAVDEGRQRLMEHDLGKVLMNYLIEIFPKIPQSELLLQKIILITWYNVTVHPIGLDLIESNFNFVEVMLNQIISQNKLQNIALKILESVLYESKNGRLFKFISDKVQMLESENGSLLQLQDLTEIIKNKLETFTNY